MSTGPSKEELENYWKTSRQYFDELARYYQTADPEYYRKNIAPFYSNPLYGGSSSKGSPALLIVIFSIGLLIAGFAAGIAFFVSGTDESEPVQKDTPKIEKKIENNDLKQIPDTTETKKEIRPPLDRERKQPLRRTR